jgi:hypothetical protein
MDAADEIKQVFVKSSKTAPEPLPKNIKKSRRVIPKSVPRKVTAKATAHKTYPMGALKGTRQTRKAKLEPTNNPSQSPRFKKGTLRVETNKGETRRVQTAALESSKRTHEQKRAELARSGHPVSVRAPPPLVDQIWKAAKEGGFLT